MPTGCRLDRIFYSQSAQGTLQGHHNALEANIIAPRSEESLLLPYLLLKQRVAVFEGDSKVLYMPLHLVQRPVLVELYDKNKVPAVSCLHRDHVVSNQRIRANVYQHIPPLLAKFFARAPVVDLDHLSVDFHFGLLGQVYSMSYLVFHHEACKTQVALVVLIVQALESFLGDLETAPEHFLPRRFPASCPLVLGRVTRANNCHLARELVLGAHDEERVRHLYPALEAKPKFVIGRLFPQVALHVLPHAAAFALALPHGRPVLVQPADAIYSRDRLPLIRPAKLLRRTRRARPSSITRRR